MIVVVVPNPAIDKTVVVPGFATGRTFRTPQALALAGGKGFNVARALRTLGRETVVVAPLGGYGGAELRRLAEADALQCAPVRIEGATRTCLTIVDPETARITEIYEGGPSLSGAEWEKLVEQVTSSVAGATSMVISGSLPPGAPEAGLRQLVERANAAGVPALLDSYGPQLAGALGARPALVKINGDEAAGLVGRRIETATHAVDALHELQARGAAAVVITLGRQGAVGLDRTGAAFGWSAPEVPGLYPIGAGDSLFGALVARLAHANGLEEALRFGVAVGAASTLEIGAGIFHVEEAEALLDEVRPLAF